ncbi:alpha/beta fold hydrolase [Oscillatoria sp. CS-180]|uniref:alpha/beta hydrolase n=1 Tax=Oscillatoria sp. CS-180 TaxID=3021720 RepID=UPI00232F3397|nr:alpha/beta hydrolase [Oscillatoria sp. CS-180]MDB9525931.1 alpha/beta fold hydrolase [Oscillatoria sp. CS-180]
MKRWFVRGIMMTAIAAGVVAHDVGRPRPAVGAEYIQVQFGLFSLSVPVEALETYAETGVAPDELDTYVNYLTPNAREQFRQTLNRQFQVDRVAIAQMGYSSIGVDFLTRLGEVVKTPSGQNGWLSTRAALILSASDPEGMSILGILKEFPTQGIHIDVARLLDLEREVTSYFSYRDATLAAIKEQSALEIADMAESVNEATIPDLRIGGQFNFTKTTLVLQNQLSDAIGAAPRAFEVDLYVPQTAPSARLSLVVISHGLGASRTDFAAMAEHLASYGFAVAVPDHPGSNTSYQLEFLANLSYEGLNPLEFVYRPWDIKTILNSLAADPTYAQRFNLEDVGIIGHSFGGYTALALAGAPLNRKRVEADCDPVQYVLNLSTLLQCRATLLPDETYDLADDRIGAVMAYSPVTSVLLGPESLSEVKTPVMIIASATDFVAPAIPEQIHPFFWLGTTEKYLTTFQPASHIAINGEIDFAAQVDVAPQVSTLLTGPYPNVTSDYAHALNVGFMETYVRDRPGYRRFLGAAYAEFLSEPAVDVQIVQKLTPEQLVSAFGGNPPIPIYPPSLPVPEID